MTVGEPPLPGVGSQPPGGMGITSQGFGQEGYVLDTRDAGVQPKPPPEELNFAVGVPYYLPFATPYRDSWEIFRDDAVTIRQLVSMRRQDGQARALYRLVTMPMLAALKNASIVSEDGEIGGTDESKFISDMFFLPASVGGMTHTFNRFAQQLLLSTFDGFTAHEMIYWSPDSGPLEGKYTLRKLDWRPPETLTFLLDGQGEFNGFRQRTFFQGRTIDVKIPKDRAFYYACGEAERPFYGVSMFESAFWHFDKKQKVYYIAHLAAQRSAVGTRIGTMPPSPNAADKNNFVKALRDLGLAQYIVCPSADWTVTNLKEDQHFDFLGYINHHNNQMSKSVLASWFDDNTGKGGGESTLVDFGTQNDETFMMQEEAIMEEMAQAINNHIIPRFIDWNFGSSKYPLFKWGQLTEDQKAAVQTTFNSLAAAGQNANITPEFMLELEQKFAADLGLDIDYDKIKAERAKQQALMEKQQQLQMQQAMANPQGAPGQPAQGGPPQGPPTQQGGGPPPGPAPVKATAEPLLALAGAL
jgi:hypothetical protein